MRYKIFYLLIVMVLTPIFFNNCKRGSEDPLFSLRSRKARLVGEWKLKKGFKNYKESSNSVNKEHHYIYDENSVKEHNKITGNETTSKYELRLIFRKDESYVLKEIINDTTYTDTGDWSFGRKDKERELKNKEYIYIFHTYFYYPDKSYSSFTGTERNMKVFVIKSLKNKKLLISEKSITKNNNKTSAFETELEFELINNKVEIK